MSLTVLLMPSIVFAGKKTIAVEKPTFKHEKEDKPQEAAKGAKSKSTRVNNPKKSQGIKNKQAKPLKKKKIKLTDRSQGEQDRIEQRLGEEAEKLLGIPYRFGGAGLKGMDCSGLTKRIYAGLFGIEMPHNSRDQSRLSFLEDVSSDELQPGDLIFLGPGKKRINHVGIYLADGKFIHASRKAGVAVSSLSNHYWQNRIIGSKRLKGLTPYADHIPNELIEDASDYDSGSQIMELGYRMPLLGEFMDVKIATFMEFNHDETEDDWEYFGYNSSYHSDAMSFRKGAWISTNARLVDWLVISPSFGYVDEDVSTHYENDGTRQILGLGARIMPFHSRWSLMMATAYSTLPDEPMQWSMLTHNDLQTLDLSFGVNYRFNELLKLSVTGTRNGRSFDNSRERLNEGLRPDDILFRFDLGF